MDLTSGYGGHELAIQTLGKSAEILEIIAIFPFACSLESLYCV